MCLFAAKLRQKLNRACNSTTRPANAFCARPKSGLSTVDEKNPNGARFRLLKALNKFALNSRNAPSPRNAGTPVRFAKLRSTAKYLGPRNELRPMPGGNRPPGLFGSKKFKPPPGKFPPGRMNASLSVSSSAPPKYRVGREGQTKSLEFAERTHCPVWGVHGKPVWAVSMP